MITISIISRPAKATRTVDKGPDLAALYADLIKRMEEAWEAVTKAPTHDDFNPDDHPHAPGGQSNGGQFVSTGGATGAKPTSTVSKIAKHAIHELLSSGHPFSISELKQITGHDNEKTIQSWMSMLKNPKTAGSKGALNIKKLPNGSFQIVMPDGNPAPPMPEVKAEPKVEAPSALKGKVTVPASPMSKADADTVYADKLSLLQKHTVFDIEDGMAPENAVRLFKNAKLTAMAQWKTNTTGVLHEPKLDLKTYEADKLLAGALASATTKQQCDDAFIKWKKDTQLEKMGKLGAPEQPKPDTKPLEKALGTWIEEVKDLPAPAPKPYSALVPKGFKHIGTQDFTAKGKENFGYQILNLKKELESLSASNAVANKKMVEQGLQEHLKDKKHYQALRALYEKKKGSTKYSLEARLISQWASSSGDHNDLSCALQIATQDAFAQPDTAVTYQQLGSAHKGHDECMKAAAASLSMPLNNAEEVRVFRQGLQEFIHGQYENTQELFKKMGKTHIFLARGMKFVPAADAFTAEPANVKLQPASSFSASYSTASSFAGGVGTVFLCKVPVSQVLGSYLTGFGCTSEHEVVVLGHDEIKSYPVKKIYASSLTAAADHVKERISKAKGVTT